jgi:hypothetical protein
VKKLRCLSGRPAARHESSRVGRETPAHSPQYYILCGPGSLRLRAFDRSSKKRVNLFPTPRDQSLSELETRRTTMSRTIILSLAAAATIAVVSLGSSAADARGFGGGRMAGGNHGAGHASGRGARLASVRNPGRGHPGHPGHHKHWHRVFRHGIWIDIDGDDDNAPDVAVAPGPCTCLTKTYTADGLVVFADVCTKEAATARVDGNTADVTPVPTPSNGAADGGPADTSQTLPADGKATDATQVGKVANATQVPTSPNYAGRTYKDYLAANPQAAPPQN